MSGRASFFQAAQRIPVGKEYDISEANAVTYTPDQLEHSNHWLGGVEGVQVQLRPYRTFLLPSSSVTVTHHTKSALLQVLYRITRFFFLHFGIRICVLQSQCSCRHPDTHHTDSNGHRQRATKAQDTPLSPRVPTVDSWKKTKNKKKRRPAPPVPYCFLK